MTEKEPNSDKAGQDESQEGRDVQLRTLWRRAAVAAGAFRIAFSASTSAADTLDDWATVKLRQCPSVSR